KDGATRRATEMKVQQDGESDAGNDHNQPPATTTPVTLTGTVSGSTGTCPTVTFMVQSTKVTVNNATTYPQTSCADATKNTASVKVTGTKQSDGSVLATSVSFTTPSTRTPTRTGAISRYTCPCPN